MLTLAPLFVSAAAESVSPHWVVDPAVPGADMPQAGASLFDRITIAADGRQQIPFPFDRLIARIEAAAGCSVDQPCTRAVLIPLGRSLQRVAASPDFFKYPRVVAAVVGEGHGQLLRDRLFVGFQQKTGVIEVISYNETLGRFEFQIVRNYAADRTAEVIYARRTVCLSCHQNQAAIFSQPVWLETNANPAVAERLAQTQPAFFGVAAQGNTDIAQSIDDATDRAGRLALTQRLWMDGCGDGAPGNACRRAALLASLQFALTGQRSYERSGESVAGRVSQTIAENSHTRWPGGLALPRADIPNRDPLDLHPGVTALSAANIDTRFDPLVPRPPEVIDVSSLGDRLVRGVADFWPARSRDALADVLERRSASIHRIRLPCHISGPAGLEQFDCKAPDGRIRGSLNRGSGTLDEVAIGDGDPVRHLPIAGVSRRAGTATWRVRSAGRRARLPSGNALERISLEWMMAATDMNGEASIEVRQDFAALVDLVTNVDTAQGPLASSLIDTLIAKLDGHEFAAARNVSPVAQVDSYAPAAAQSGELALQFESQCGACHHTAESTPPNFLSGSPQRVNAAIASCAPRIFARLAMRDVPSQRRAKSPMPPELPTATARAFKPHPADARALVELQVAVSAVLRREYGRNVALDELLRHGYEALRPCLPPATARETGHGRTDS